jgi:hypothetical protein
MLKMFQLVAIASAVAFFYYSSPPSGYPSEQQDSAEQKAKEQTVKQHPERSFIQFMFPDSLAVFTFFLFLATVGLATIAVIQIGFLNRAERISATAANAAQKSAKVAEDTLIAGDRPWIGPETIDIVPLTVGGTFQATIRWRNTGHSPALQARIYTEGRKVDVGDLEPARLAEFPAEVDTTLMMPNEVGATLIFHNSRINNQAAIDAIKGGTIKLWLLGLAEYKDIYGRVHTTVFRERYDPDVGAYRSIDGTAD